MSAEFLKIKSTSKLAVSLTITMSDTTTKTMVIREGDRVSNLTYLSAGNGKLETITGDVKVIRFNATSRQVTPECIHSTESDFAARVAATDLVVDCSDVYSSDIRVIPITSIRNFESDDLGEMVVSDAKLISDSEVSFIATSTPVAAIWNGDTVIPTQEDPNIPVYTATITTMQKMNTLIVIDADNRCKLSVPGVVPVVTLGSELESAITTSVNAFIEKYINKVTDNINVEVPDDEFYVTVATGVTDTDTVSVGDETYKSDASILLNIGTGSRVNKEAFKIVDRKLMISPLILILQSDNYGNVDITVNGFTMSCLTGMTQEDLTIGKVEVIGGAENAENTVVVDESSIIHTRQDGSAGIKVELTGSNDDLTDTVVLVKSVFSEADVATEYAFITMTGTSVVLPENDLDGYVTAEKAYSVDHSIASIKGFGAANVSITTVENVYERPIPPETSEGEAPSGQPTDPNPDEGTTENQGTQNPTEGEQNPDQTTDQPSGETTTDPTKENTGATEPTA